MLHIYMSFYNVSKKNQSLLLLATLSLHFFSHFDRALI